MSKPTIQVTIVDSTGNRQRFQARDVEFDSGCGCIDIRPGEPDFCRGFDRGVLTLDDGTSVTTLEVTRGLASLMGNAMNVACDRVTLGHRAWGEDPIEPEACPRLETGAPSQASSCLPATARPQSKSFRPMRTTFRPNQRKPKTTKQNII